MKRKNCPYCTQNHYLCDQHLEYIIQERALEEAAETIEGIVHEVNNLYDRIDQLEKLLTMNGIPLPAEHY